MPGYSEDFRRRAGQHRKRIDLEQQRDERTRALVRLSGPGEKMNSFLESLNNSDRSRLDAECGELKDEIDKVEGTRSELREERGKISKHSGAVGRREEIICPEKAQKYTKGTASRTCKGMVATRLGKDATGEDTTKV